jgi:hypothetical protein
MIIWFDDSWSSKEIAAHHASIVAERRQVYRRIVLWAFCRCFSRKKEAAKYTAIETAKKVYTPIYSGSLSAQKTPLLLIRKKGITTISTMIKESEIILLLIRLVRSIS